ncbi:hypothetical protein CCMA1212_008865 [Trichoderma ghanense]|uniref:Uncharacterized protein n=1 Tax=Trichoderma ghanense TaxID=65468 RepID=A0ABY2GTZ2_9HYPO
MPFISVAWMDPSVEHSGTVLGGQLGRSLCSSGRGRFAEETSGSPMRKNCRLFVLSCLWGFVRTPASCTSNSLKAGRQATAGLRSSTDHDGDDDDDGREGNARQEGLGSNSSQVLSNAACRWISTQAAVGICTCIVAFSYARPAASGTGFAARQSSYRTPCVCLGSASRRLSSIAPVPLSLSLSLSLGGPPSSL